MNDLFINNKAIGKAKKLLILLFRININNKNKKKLLTFLRLSHRYKKVVHRPPIIPL